MDLTLYVPVSESFYLDVVNLLERKGVQRSPASFIAELAEYGLSNADWKDDVFFPELVEDDTATVPKNYVWKHPSYRKPLLLEHGTQMKMEYPKGTFKTAIIDNGEIKMEGKTYVSPSQLASAIAVHTSRSAPRDFIIKLPSSTTWRRALEMFIEVNK